jgi:hypothetical protein
MSFPILALLSFLRIWFWWTLTIYRGQAILMRLTAEMFLLQDKSWETPGMRLEAFSQIHEASRRVAAAAGVSDVHAWLPPEIDASFGRRLMTEFGWKKQLWPCFSREIQNG